MRLPPGTAGTVIPGNMKPSCVSASRVVQNFSRYAVWVKESTRALNIRISSSDRSRPSAPWISWYFRRTGTSSSEEPAKVRPSATPGTAVATPVDEPREPERDQQRKEQQVVAVRQRLHQPGGGKERQPAPAPVVKVGVHREERERHPLRRQHLEVRQLRRAIRRERERRAGQQPRRGRSRQLAAEQEGEYPGEPGGEDQRDVVGGDRD